MSAVTSRASAILAAALAGTFVVYAALAALAGWWPSALAAPVVAVLLWLRHARARFAAYVFLSVVAVRAVTAAAWPALAFALAGIAILQTRTATRAWPRLAPAGGRAARAGADGDRMTRP